MGRSAVPYGAAGEAVRLNVRRLREAQRLTTRELAAKMTAAGRPMLGNGITKIETGNRHVDIDDLVALAECLGVTPERLLVAFECARCNGSPPQGFVCGTCGSGRTDG